MNTAVAEVVENPFATAPVAARPENDALVAVQSAREVAEVQSAMVIARRFPRVEVEVMDRILNACTRPSLAEGALYEFARGGSDIRGPSIRLAECIAQYWGHIDYGWRVVEERPGVTKVQAFAWDMQTGTRSQMVFDVVHEVGLKGGAKKSLHDPRDIYEHVANAASRRLRACVLRVIPSDVVDAAVRQCEATLRLKAEVTPERLKNLLAQFAELGVSKPQIEQRIQRRVDAMTPGQMVQLGKIFTSLRDGMSQPGDWFAVDAPAQAAQEAAGAAPDKPAPTTARGAVKAKLDARKQPKDAPAPAPAPAPATAPAREVSDALKDVVNFARAATTLEDVERAVSIATQISDPDESKLAQEHIDAAKRRVTS